MKQIPLPIAHRPEPTLANFLAGANAPAVAHLHALALPAAPLYLWGPAGSGKTHLLRAAAALWQAQGHRVAWFDAAAPLPWQPASGCSAVLIDRCDLLDADAQHAAFTLFVNAATEGMQVAAAGRLPPVDLPVREDLRTRLGWGHVFALQPLSDAETRSALRREGDRRGVLMPDDVVQHLLTHEARDLSHLMRLFDRLDHFALAEGRRITLPLLRQMLAEAPEAPEASPS